MQLKASGQNWEHDGEMPDLHLKEATHKKWVGKNNCYLPRFPQAEQPQLPQHNYLFHTLPVSKADLL